MNKDDNKCVYLEKLKRSVNRYQETIYSQTYKKRLENFRYFIPAMVVRGDFIKIGCHYGTKRICIKSYLSRKEFTKDIERIDEQRIICKVQNSNVSSFYIGDCLHIVLFECLDKIYLLHNSDEDKKLILPRGTTVELDNFYDYIIVDDAVVLYLNFRL